MSDRPTGHGAAPRPQDREQAVAGQEGQLGHTWAARCVILGFRSQAVGGTSR